MTPPDTTISFDEPTRIAVVSERFDDEGRNGEWVKETDRITATHVHFGGTTIAFEHRDGDEMFMVSSEAFIQMWTQNVYHE